MPTQEIKTARTCYDHMAGELGVAVTDALVKNRLIKLDGKNFEITPQGTEWFGKLGIDVDEQRARKRKFSYACIDWTERVPHLAGSMGEALCSAFFERKWIKRTSTPRAIELTPQGKIALREHLNVRLDSRD